MPESEPIFILLTTFNRTELALITINSVLANLRYENIKILIADDGSDEGHLSQVREACGDYCVDAYNSQRRGVGHGMNWGLKRTRELGGQILLVLEDDWEILKPLSIDTHIRLLLNHEDIGMIRFGYLSAGLNGTVIARENHLWLRLDANGNQYRYAGHPHLCHLRLHDEVGFFKEGLAAGANELNFSGRYNALPAPPSIVWDMNYGHQGPFCHIGSESLADIEPEK